MSAVNRQQAVQSGGRGARDGGNGGNGEQPRTRDAREGVTRPGLVDWAPGLASRGSDATGGSCKTGFTRLGLARMAWAASLPKTVTTLSDRNSKCRSAGRSPRLAMRPRSWPLVRCMGCMALLVLLPPDLPALSARALWRTGATTQPAAGLPLLTSPVSAQPQPYTAASTLACRCRFLPLPSRRFSPSPLFSFFFSPLFIAHSTLAQHSLTSCSDSFLSNRNQPPQSHQSLYTRPL